MTKIVEAAGLPAAAGLLAHIRASGRSIPEWCEQKGLDRFKVERAIKGRLKRADVEFALAVERATEGAVPAADWVPQPPSQEPAA